MNKFICCEVKSISTQCLVLKTMERCLMMVKILSYKRPCRWWKKKIGWHVMSSELYSYEHWLCRMVDWSRYETWRHMKKLSGGKPSMDVFSLTWLNLAEWIWTKNNMKMQNQLKKRRCWSWAARTTLNYGKINCLAPNEEEKIGIRYENKRHAM